MSFLTLREHETFAIVDAFSADGRKSITHDQADALDMLSKRLASAKGGLFTHANRTTLKARQYVGMVSTPGGGHRGHPEDRWAERPGALLTGLQATLNAFQPERFQFEFDEFTVDTPLNRVLETGTSMSPASICSTRNHTPCFRLASMKPSRSPSSTPWVLPTS